MKRRKKAVSVSPFEMVASHNREKRYILKEGQPVDFLVDLGVMTREGQVVHSRYDKFRQITAFWSLLKISCRPWIKGGLSILLISGVASPTLLLLCIII